MRYLFIFILIISAWGLQAQNQSLLKDTAVNCFMVSAVYSFQIPMADMGERFGPNSTIGGGLSFKMKKNIIIGVEGGYLFGRTVKDPGQFDHITIDGVNLITPDGALRSIQTSERGYQFKAYLGKVFAFKNPNANSGILFTMGFGVLQHKIRIDVEEGDVPYLNSDYKQGYDRLASGFMVAPFLGYHYQSLNKRINFFAGVEFMAAFTQNRREWNFDTNTPTDGSRKDMLIGFKAGWILPIYFIPTEKYYYY